jgi:uncharacterized membrane protein YqjE
LSDNTKPHPAASRSADGLGVAERLRALAADVLELAQVRLELFSLEAREACLRLITLAALAVGSVVVISFGLSFLAGLVIALLWNTYRLWTLGVCAAVFLAGGCVLLMLARSCLKGLSSLFAATRG